MCLKLPVNIGVINKKLKESLCFAVPIFHQMTTMGGEEMSSLCQASTVLDE